MKNKFHILVFLILGSLLMSCESDDLDYKNDFESSRKAWLEFKELTDNSYKY